MVWRPLVIVEVAVVVPPALVEDAVLDSPEAPKWQPPCSANSLSKSLKGSLPPKKVSNILKASARSQITIAPASASATCTLNFVIVDIVPIEAS